MLCCVEIEAKEREHRRRREGGWTNADKDRAISGHRRDIWIVVGPPLYIFVQYTYTCICVRIYTSVEIKV